MLFFSDAILSANFTFFDFKFLWKKVWSGKQQRDVYIIEIPTESNDKKKIRCIDMFLSGLFKYLVIHGILL